VNREYYSLGAATFLNAEIYFISFFRANENEVSDSSFVSETKWRQLRHRL
jgi:hypothetical protein